MDKKEHNRNIKNNKSDKTKATFDLHHGMIPIAAIVVFLTIIAYICIKISISIENAAIGVAIIRDINVLLISTNATLIGLYVTAFIFLNDSLKTRVKEDPTLGEAVSSILSGYRRNMFWISFATVVSIFLEILNNIFLGGDGRDDLENWSIPLNDWRWLTFIIISIISLSVTIWIIQCSKQITHSDGLIADYSRVNLKRHEAEITRYYDNIVELLKKGGSDNGISEFKDPQNWDASLLDIVKQHNIDVLDVLDKKSISTSNVGHDTDDAKLSDKKGAHLLPYLRERLRKSAKRQTRFDNDVYREKEIIFGKRVRLLENIISKICENNIDKSIMNDEFLYDSMCSGFQWLYSRKRLSKIRDEETGEKHQDQEREAMFVDVRDEKRFLDYVKYQIITDPVFDDHRPYDNDEVEELFSYVADKFKLVQTNGKYDEQEVIRHHEEKINRIEAYKNEMYYIIRDFFDGYKSVVGYRDALIHFKKFSRSDNRRQARKEREIVSKSIEKINQYAELLIRVMIDRFTSFVKINDLNLGNTTFNKGWFNYSELSGSNFTHSSFKYARIENAIVKNCDLSTCSFVGADASGTDFSESNFSYSNLTGMDLQGALLNKAQMNSIILRDKLIDRYDGLMSLFHYLEDVSKDELRKWLATSPTTKFKGKNFSQDTANLIVESQKILEIASDDLDQHICGSEIESVSQIFMDKVIACDRAHEEYKLPERYFRRLTDAKKAEAKRTAGKNEEEKRGMVFTKERRERDYGKIFFGVANLSSVTGSEVKIKDTDFSYVTMEDSSLVDSDISNAEMYYTNAYNAMFRSSNLNELDAYKATFTNVNFTEANLMNSLFLNCDLREVNFNRAILLHATIASSLDGIGEKLYVKRFTAARKGVHNKMLERFDTALEHKEVQTGNDYQYASITDITESESNVSCTDSVFTEIIANNINILNINAMRSIFTKATMKDAVLCNDFLRWCDFEEVHMTNALVLGCSLTHSNLLKANFSRSKIFSSEISNANLSEAKFISTSISKTLFEECNLDKANFGSSNINNCSFYKCKFAGVNIGGVEFNNCIFYDFDFTNAIGLDAAVFNHCIFMMDNLVIDRQNYRTLSLDTKDIEDKRGCIKVVVDEDQQTEYITYSTRKRRV